MLGSAAKRDRRLGSAGMIRPITAFAPRERSIRHLPRRTGGVKQLQFGAILLGNPCRAKNLCATPVSNGPWSRRANGVRHYVLQPTVITLEARLHALLFFIAGRLLAKAGRRLKCSRRKIHYLDTFYLSISGHRRSTFR